MKVIRTTSKTNATCAPGRKYVDGHCAPLGILIEMAQAYNKEYPNDRIDLFSTLETLNPSKYKRYLVTSFDSKLKNKCANHKCWTTQKFTRHMNEIALNFLTNHTYRPDGPQGRFTWLSNIDIAAVMNQYEKKIPSFKFFGAVPMDFAELDFEINDAIYDALRRTGKTKLGIIFNLDNHDQSGSHWVAMFSNLDTGEIYYFDSLGVGPTSQVRKLMRHQHREMTQMGFDKNKIIVEHNRNQHQKENTECGVYSMNFLIRMAKGHSFHNICNRTIPDKKMNKCRKIYFDCNSK